MPEFVDAVAEALTPVDRHAIIAGLRSRTQLRLLRLHAKVIEYRWEHEQLPESLKAAVSDGTEIDPLSGEAFVFERPGVASYRIYGKGMPGVGEIELRYRAPVREPEGTPPPRLR